MLQFSFMQRAEIGRIVQNAIDFGDWLWYAEYVGAIIGTASEFAHFAAIMRLFVNFTMETF